MPDAAKPVAIVAGGTGGIGSAITRALARQGKRVVTLSRRGGEDAPRADGGEVHHETCDLTDHAGVLAAVDRVCTAHGRPDVLVHAAGGKAPGGVSTLSVDGWRAGMAIHLDSVFFLCRAALPHMTAAKRGSIVLVSSAAGLRAVSGDITYATAKAATVQFMRCLAREAAPSGIRVNCVAPGFVDTAFHDPGKDRGPVHDRIPLGRFGAADEVAKMVCALLDNAYATGETVVLDGGINLGFSAQEAALRERS